MNLVRTLRGTSINKKKKVSKMKEVSNTGKKVSNTENSARKQRFLKSKTKKPRSIENEKLTESNKKHSRTGHQET